MLFGAVQGRRLHAHTVDAVQHINNRFAACVP